jgi:hypothetical protein
MSDSAGWEALTRELDLWATEGRTATFWWRDDDATAPTRALDKLRACAIAASIPVALAVIPAKVTPELIAELRDWPSVRVLQHGLSHTNHETPPAKKTELGPARPAQHVIADLITGWNLLQAFDHPLPVLVPPWNRISPGLIGRLPGLGYKGLSAFTPRAQPHPAPGLLQVNTHVDIVDWRGGGVFAGTSATISATVRHLSARRNGAADPEEPTGLLTHHLVHDADCERFLDQFTAATSRHPAASWLDARDIFGSPS